jgi:hypothetical protein
MLKYLADDAKINAAFDDDTVRILVRAFDEACQALDRSGALWRLDPDTTTAARERIARRIIDLARLGERDRRLLRDNALLSLSQSFRGWRPY